MAADARWAFVAVVALWLACSDASRNLSENKLTCDACRAAYDTLKGVARRNASEELITKTAVEVCILFKIQDRAVCEGIVPLMAPAVLAVLLGTDATADEVCGLAKVCPKHPSNWTVTFPKPKPPHVPPQHPNATNPRYSVVHVSDIHYDSLYVPGTLAKCPDPLCCREADGPGGKNTSAGIWGDFNCDTSPAMLEYTFKHLASLQPAPKYVLWTGDNPPHDVWMGSRAQEQERLKNISALIAATWPDVPVFPALGNHDTFPVDSFPLPPANAWNYDGIVQYWAQWLTPDAQKTFAYGGFYQMLVHEGLRLISLNTNYCDGSNFWLMLNSTDPAGMYTWLIDVLQAAEDAKEKVWIIAHETPGDCGGALGDNLNLIIDRYEDTIVGQFYGHHHTDQFLMFYAVDEPTRATSMAYIAPSVTTYTGKNPQYRMYDVDQPSSQVVESYTYNADVRQANANNQPQYVLEYAATVDYGMAGLLPSDWDALVQRFATNNTLFQQFYSYFNSEAPAGPCDASCVKQFICTLKSATSALYSQCMSA